MNFRTFVNESSVKEYVNNRLTTSLKKEGIEYKQTDKLGYTKFTIHNIDIVNDGVGISVKQNGTEIEYYNTPKLDYKKAVAKAMDLVGV